MELRPTTDRAREALFNVLRHLLDWPSMHALDLCCGTGSIGLEMLSRGAARVDFVDHSPVVTKHILDTLKAWDLDNKGQAFQSDAFRWLRQGGQAWDLIFMDPPYGLDDYAKLPGLALERGLLAKEGLMICEHGPEMLANLEQMPGYLETRKYGSVHFSFFKNPSEIES